MQMKDIARRLPDELWEAFRPYLPEKVYAGNGRPPASNRDCLHALLYVLVTGIGWDYLPFCFPSAKTVQRRLKEWLRSDAFLGTWKDLAEKYQQINGINWDQILLDGSKKPSKKGANRRGHLRSIAVSRALPST